MNHLYAKRTGNVHLIDTNMFGFDRFQSCYLVKAEEIALIDSGVPTSIDSVRKAIKGLGVAIEDISHIFVTHCEHPDHSGNVGALLRENTRAKVYIHSIGMEYLTRPEIEAAKRKAILPPEMAARFGEMIPVPEDRIVLIQNGDRVPLGGDQTLRAIFTPGHQPSGMVFYDERNRGLFIHDLIGMYLADADFHMVLTPNRSEVKKYMESLHKVKDLPMETLFLGHFGISQNPGEVIERALGLMQGLMDIGAECMDKGKPEEIAPRFRNFVAPQLEKLRTSRGGELYSYLKDELVASCSEAFSIYYQGLST